MSKARILQIPHKNPFSFGLHFSHRPSVISRLTLTAQHHVIIPVITPNCSLIYTFFLFPFVAVCRVWRTDQANVIIIIISALLRFTDYSGVFFLNFIRIHLGMGFLYCGQTVSVLSWINTKIKSKLLLLDLQEGKSNALFSFSQRQQIITHRFNLWIREIILRALNAINHRGTWVWMTHC